MPPPKTVTPVQPQRSSTSQEPPPVAPPVEVEAPRASGRQYLQAKLAQAQQEAASLADALDNVMKERDDAVARAAALEAQLNGAK